MFLFKPIIRKKHFKVICVLEKSPFKLVTIMNNTYASQLKYKMVIVYQIIEVLKF